MEKSQVELGALRGIVMSDQQKGTSHTTRPTMPTSVVHSSYMLTFYKLNVRAFLKKIKNKRETLLCSNTLYLSRKTSATLF